MRAGHRGSRDYVVIDGSPTSASVDTGPGPSCQNIQTRPAPVTSSYSTIDCVLGSHQVSSYPARIRRFLIYTALVNSKGVKVSA
ncbi:hypothetical protein NC651_011558 [Populus alba x Populus x berolinensis]|nr:hypothetical protein NC651_011558 [Populus alba x Populus x berolinensis]